MNDMDMLLKELESRFQNARDTGEVSKVGGIEMFYSLDPGAYRPEYAHKEDAGMDIRTPRAFTIDPHDSVVIDTGVHVGIPKGCCGLLVSKSGLNTKHRITSTGLIDEGFTGSIRVRLQNDGDMPYTFYEGDKITQVMIVPVLHADLYEIDSLFSPAAR